MRLITWSPTTQSATVLNEIDSWFNNVSSDFPSFINGVSSWKPTFEVLNTENAYRVRAELPGMIKKDVNIEVDASDATNGEYFATILVSSNVQDTIEIPVSLTVADMGMIGDLNNDDTINVADVVILIGIILNAGDYLYNGDINQDGTIDVLDVVMLVTDILDE